MTGPSALSPRDVLVDLFGGPDFDHEILDAGGAADIIIERLGENGMIIIDMRLAIRVP
jgi:hypothetical protein